MPKLTIENFAHIREASIDFGDLTVLVGAQGSGKSLILQWLKTVIDGKQIVSALHEAGDDVSSAQSTIDLIFGAGMGTAWRDDTLVRMGKVRVRPSTIGRLGSGVERVFFIPAHRAMLISDGWAAQFQKLTADTPVVARLFSQTLFDRFNRRAGNELFPLPKVLKREYRELIDDAVFHGGTVGIERDRHNRRRLQLTHGDTRLPFMTWTAGQREFTPLLLGLYHVLPSRREQKVREIDWVVIEEPEMGLHPQAITAFLLLVLDMLWRGYRVVISTHSPLVLTAVWMMRRLQELDARWQLVLDGFGIDVGSRQALKNVAVASLEKSYRTYLLAFEEGVVSSKNISRLDPWSDVSEEAEWGGLTGFASHFSEAVATAVNEAGQ